MNALPAALVEVLPAGTARTWLRLRDHLPDALVLYGGTALAAHLHHRVSRDLDFFYQGDLDLAALRSTLESLGTFAATTATGDTLNGVFNDTKVQFLQARDQEPLEPATVIAGIKVAGLRDIAATKIKVITDRGELRDYYDLMAIEQRTPITIEAALLDYQERYRTNDRNTLTHIIRALGYLDDVTDDPGLPTSRRAIEAFWAARVRTLSVSVDSTGTVRTHASAVADRALRAPTDTATGQGAGKVWVEAYERNGRLVNGYWRRR